MKIQDAIQVVEKYAQHVWKHGIYLPNGSRIPVVFIWGSYGIGKSSMVKALCKNGVGFLDRRLAEDDITNLKGIIDLLKDSRFCTWRLPDDIPFEGNDKVPEKGIWFLDEFNMADKSVKKGAFEAILDHSIGGVALKKNWYIVCAGNEKSQSIYVEELGKPLETRFLHLTAEPDLAGASAWGLSSGRMKPEVIAFLNWKPELFAPQDVKTKATRGFPCPRTWEFISTLWDLTAPEYVFDMFMGAVGEGAAIELNTYLKVWKELPNIDKILQGEDLIPTRKDILYAVSTSIVDRVRGADKSKAMKLAERVIEYSLKLDKDFSVFLVKLLYKSLAPEMSTRLITTSVFKKWCSANASAFDF